MFVHHLFCEDSNTQSKRSEAIARNAVLCNHQISMHRLQIILEKCIKFTLSVYIYDIHVKKDIILNWIRFNLKSNMI